MDSSTTVKSPIDPSVDARLVRAIPTGLIIQSYAGFGIDVARFFEGIDRISIFECPATGYRFYSPFAAAGDSRFYEEVQLAYEEYYVQDREEFSIALKKL